MICAPQGRKNNTRDTFINSLKRSEGIQNDLWLTHSGTQKAHVFLWAFLMWALNAHTFFKPQKPTLWAQKAHKKTYAVGPKIIIGKIDTPFFTMCGG